MIHLESMSLVKEKSNEVERETKLVHATPKGPFGLRYLSGARCRFELAVMSVWE